MTLQLSRQFILVFLCFICSAGYAAGADHVAEYQLNVQLHPETQQLEGEARISVIASQLASGLVLRLSPQAELLSLGFDGHSLSYDFTDGLLTIHPLKPVDSRPSILFIRYRARYADPLPESTVGMENPSFGVSATINSVGTYLSSGTAWFPQLQSVPELYRIRIEGPSGLYGVTSGRLVDHGTVSGKSFTRWETSFPLDGLALSAGYYQIFEEGEGDIQVLAFLTKQNAALASSYLDSTKRYLRFYQGVLGRYPFPKFAVVENFLPTGYGLPSWTLLGSNVIALPFIPYTSLPHEIVHSWFGNAVKVDYQTGNWAEGLTSYLADYLLKEQSSDEQGRNHRLKLLRDYAALVTPKEDYPLSQFVSRSSRTDQAIGYGKAAMVFHMLRQRIGEEAFWSSLRKLAAEGSGKRLGWSDLEQTFSRTAGQDLSTFFRQWVNQAGAPQLHFKEVAVASTGEGWLVRGKVVQTGDLYSLVVPLRVKTEAGNVEQSISVSKEQTAFAIRTDVSPLQLSGDPDAHLFRRLQIDELPATINDLRASQNLLVVARSAQDPLLKASGDLLSGLQKSKAQVVSWQKFDPVMAKQHDLLFIGWPPPDLIARSIDPQLQMEQDSFYWSNVRYQEKMDSLFVCRKAIASTNNLIAVFHPLSYEAARKVSRKIPHYGRYSHLVFKDGTNVVKGTDEPETSPLRVDLN
ncbi:MAG TPA: M1 family aminopeptidase [Geopsychrobacteraceae bacterium]|nr:M1 family aminopeptidase [Geopsychrobacteraceae bacterium]